MYTVIDIAFAAMILIIGIIVITYLLVGGTTINTGTVNGIESCIYSQIGNNIIPTLLKEGKYTYVKEIVQSCGAGNIVIEKDGKRVYPQNPKIVEQMLSKCSHILTIMIPMMIRSNNVNYELIICIR